eukprot:1462143-Rhodomonas_salina.2
MDSRRVASAFLIWITTQALLFSAVKGDCAFRRTCVPKVVCDCTPGTPGCVLGSQQCPFPAAGAPCVLGPNVPPEKVIPHSPHACLVGSDKTWV